MKQGTASTSKSGSTKTEPKSKAVSVGCVSNIGIQQRYAKTPPMMYQGRGLEAPAATRTIHATGSQGKR